MTIYYVENRDGAVVGQFDGVEITMKDGHDKHVVESVDDLPGVDEWDSDYL